MLVRPLSTALVAGACVLLGAFAGVAHAEESVASVSEAAVLDVQAVRQRLQRMQRAANGGSFEGVFVVSSGGVVSSARITHYSEGRDQYEHVETMDGRLRRVFRHNDVVHTFWPKARVALIERRDGLTGFPAMLAGNETRITASYDARSLGEDRVAGLDADVMELVPRDEARFAHRLWTDKATGLLLRSEVVDRKENVLESSAFSEVQIGVRNRPELVLKAMKRLEGYRVVTALQEQTSLEAEGWSLTPPLSGFEPQSCVRRPIGDTLDRAADGPTMIQAIYSDGMTFVSVFIEAFDADRHTSTVARMSGATGTWMQRQDDAWITVVGDVPGPTLKRFARALTRRP